MIDVEPTPEELANGWTKETLNAYLADRERAASRLIARDPDVVEPKRPTKANGKYAPHRWRR